jgi:hypothetical protein
MILRALFSPQPSLRGAKPAAGKSGSKWAIDEDVQVEDEEGVLPADVQEVVDEQCPIPTSVQEKESERLTQTP